MKINLLMIPSEDVRERSNRYNEFVRNSEAVMDSFTQVKDTNSNLENTLNGVNPRTEVPSQGNCISHHANDNNSIVERSSIKSFGGKSISRFKAPVKTSVKIVKGLLNRNQNSGAKTYVDSHFTGTQSNPGASSTQIAFTEGSGAGTLPTKHDDNYKSLEGRISNDIIQEQPPQNNIDFLPTFERMFDKIIPLLTPQ